MKKKGMSLTGVRRRNVGLIHYTVYFEAPVTRQQVADELGLSLPTITTNVASMLEEGLLQEVDHPEAGTESSGGGRIAHYLDYVPDTYYALGVDLGPYSTIYCLCDLRGNILMHRIYPPADASYDEMVVSVSQQLSDFLRECPVKKRLLGICVAAPGLVDKASGCLLTTFRHGWRHRPLRDDLAAAVHLPVMLENNSVARSFRYILFERFYQFEAMAYLFVSRGIGCPIVMKSNPLSTERASVGEVGHTTMVTGGPICPNCGQRGCLEALASEAAILETVSVARKHDRCRQLEVVPKLDMAAVLRAQENGDPDVREILWEALDYIAMEVSNIIKLTNVERFVMDGQLFTLAENREYLLRQIRKYSNETFISRTHIVFIPYDILTGALGAAATVIRSGLLVGDPSVKF